MLKWILGFKVFKRLQRLHLCASHQTTLNTLDYLGKDFDASVKQWKSDMMDKTTTSSHIQVSIIIPSPILRCDCVCSVEHKFGSQWNR